MKKLEWRKRRNHHGISNAILLIFMQHNDFEVFFLDFLINSFRHLILVNVNKRNKTQSVVAYHMANRISAIVNGKSDWLLFFQSQPSSLHVLARSDVGMFFSLKFPSKGLNYFSISTVTQYDIFAYTNQFSFRFLTRRKLSSVSAVQLETVNSNKFFLKKITKESH
jgi:hypothetical protein